MPHEDGDAYADVVATVSLGGWVCLDIVPKPTSFDQAMRGRDGGGDGEGNKEEYKIPTRIFQEPRSLLVTTGAAYRELMHGISAVEVDEDLSAETIANWGLLGDNERIKRDGGRNVRITRVSLTYRDVLKVSIAASKVLGGLIRH